MNIQQKLELATEVYASYGVSVPLALAKLKNVALSINAWQADDVLGFENASYGWSGGCQVTGNYPGRARSADEVRQDLEFALQFIPGSHRVCLQAHQVDKMFPGVDRDGFTIDNFSVWRDWSKEKGVPLDIAPAYYAHPKLDHGLSLSHPDAAIRDFWINHGKAVRRIGAEFAKVSGKTCAVNQWLPDGFKDTPADRLAPRVRMRNSLDQIFANKLEPGLVADALETKLFGIGAESCTVTSHEFCVSYAASRNIMMCIDSGHYHPTEHIGDKVSALKAMGIDILFHVSRGVHWDSDHVIVLNDELLSIGRELAFCGLDGVYVGLDFFDATINRVAAWVIGAQNMLKSLLIGFLEPSSEICASENGFDFTSRLALQENAKTLPWSAVWEAYLEENGVPSTKEFLKALKAYETEVQFKRV